jgi:hypothetical protein
MTSRGERNDRRDARRNAMLTRQRFLSPIVAIAVVVSLAGSIRAAGDEDRIDAAAMESLERLSAYLAHAKRFQVTIDVAYDVVQEWGQKLEFGETRVVTVRRPDRLRVDTTDRDGSVSGLVFDGRAIAAFDLDEKVYASTPQPGTLDDAIDHFVEDLGMRLPMAPLLQGRLDEDVKGWARDVRYVEASTIGGVACDHVAIRGDWEDVQLWIGRGDRPLLQRLVITYTRAEGKPQFSAQLRSWNLDPDASDVTFAFTPSAGATRIAFKSRRPLPGGPGRGAGAQP